MVPWELGVTLICLFVDLTTEENLHQSFRLEPENVTVQEGETVLLKCEVDNLSGLVQWVKDGLLLGPNLDIPRFPRYRMVGEPSKGEYNLQITRSQLEDDAQYECQVGPSERSRGIVSRSVFLMVLVPPQRPLIQEYEANSTVTWVAGTEYTLNCQVTDARPAAEITFSKGDNDVPSETSSSQPSSTDKLFHTKAMLRITPQSSDNRKWLRCRAKNEVSFIPLVVGFIMNILFPPQPPIIKGYKEDPAVKAKDKLTLTCISVGGNPLATLQWLKNGEVISTNWETDDTSQLSRSVLTLSLAIEDNMATVTCQAMNRVLPFAMQTSVTLHVVYRPEQVVIIGSTSTQENKAISLSCYTTPSNPAVQLRWWLGSRELNATDITITEATHGGKITMSNLTHTAHREENGLRLMCEAFNEATLFAKSADVALDVQYPTQKIWIDVPPADACFRAGTQVKLICFASGGNPKPRLNWYKESSVVTAEKPVISGNIVSRELILTTAPSDNMATYRCNASNLSKIPALTAYTRLHIQFPPLHAKIPVTEKEVRRGQSLTLSCVSGSSNPSASLTWLKDGVKLNATNLEQKKSQYGGFSTSGKVTLVVSSADHGKRVECHVYSSVLSEGVNTFYQLNILFPPEFSTEQPLLVQTVEHGAVLLPLLVSANPLEITYRWSFLGKVLLTVGSPRYHLREGGALEIWNVTRADAGKYQIHCKNSEGHNATTIFLDVQYPPSILSIEDPTFVDLGGTAEIVCKADANPVPAGMFTWKWLGGSEHSLEELGTEQLSEGLVGRLLLRDAQQSHAGLYECQADNGISPAARSTAHLVVRYPPQITKGPGQRKVAVSGDGRSEATLQCHAQGVPRVHFSWAKNGVPLDPHSPRYTVLTTHKDSWHTGSLTIANVSAFLDYATFTCTASNVLGTDTLDIQLLSTSHPDPPTGLKVVNVAHNQLTLKWVPGFDGGLQQSFRVRYHWSGARSFLYVDVFPPQSTVFTVMGLHPNTLYNVSVSARNALGESAFADGGAGLSVTTAELEEEPMDRDPKTPSLLEPESLPLSLLGVLGAIGGILVVSNLAFLGCFLYRRQAQTFKGPKTQVRARAIVRNGNNYADSKWLKLRGSLEDRSLRESTSPTGSSAETTTGSAAAARPWSRLGRYVDSETEPSITDPNIAPPWLSSPEFHEYEEVMVPRRSEEVAPLYQVWYPKEAPWLHEYENAYQQSGKSLAGYEDATRIYDPVADSPPPGGDGELPFEQQGELV